MPGARTYQTIGFATYHGGRFLSRRKKAEAQREAERQAKRHKTKVRGVVIAAVVVGVAALAARRGSGATV
jgi:hypothetical protein